MVEVLVRQGFRLRATVFAGVHWANAKSRPLPESGHTTPQIRLKARQSSARAFEWFQHSIFAYRLYSVHKYHTYINSP